MAYYHVLLNGTGTSGDGSTWNDLSDATSAFIGYTGLNSAVAGAGSGDTIYVKGTESVATGTTLSLGKSVTLALAQVPLLILGCKSATTNTGASIVTSDLIAGLRTGDVDEAWNDADVPTVTNTSSAIYDVTAGVYIYGIKFVTAGTVTLASGGFGEAILEEVYFETTNSANEVGQTGILGRLNTYNCKLVTPSGHFINAGYSEHYKTTFSTGVGATAFFSSENFYGTMKCYGAIFEGGCTTIIQKKNSSLAAYFHSCKFPTSWVFTTGTAAGAYRFESYGSDSTTGLTTGGSEQQINIEDQHGTIVTETVKVRTGGATDGAAGTYSLDMSAFASATLPGVTALSVRLAPIWVAGDGTSKTFTVYVTSDSGNTRATDWDTEHVWMRLLSPDDAGTSGYDYQTTAASLLATGTPVTDDTGSTWGAGTQNDQKVVGTVAGDYEGYVIPELCFSPGTNAETLYADPLPVVT